MSSTLFFPQRPIVSENYSGLAKMKILRTNIFFMLAMFLIESPTAAHAQSNMHRADSADYKNRSLADSLRIDDLVSRMTLEEKTGQMLYNAPAIDRLGIPAYNWWNEGLHGVARAGKATVFPQAIGLAATWDSDLMSRIGDIVSTEARAKHHHSVRRGGSGIYEGLTFWAPNINIFRDPRWGRGMETYGEDPYLAGRLAVEFIRGMQGEGGRYLKTVATPKHFAVHSGPEPKRHQFDAVVSEGELMETYLPQFRDAVIEGNAQSVMCAYNRFRGIPCCGSSELLQRILRDRWGFRGYVVSDCWAIMDFFATHKVVPNMPEAAAMALEAGTDLNCGVSYDSLAFAVRNGLVSEKLVDDAVKRLFSARFRLGMFDPPDLVTYTKIPVDTVDCARHRDAALEAARKSIVLLKNEKNFLPLSKNIKSVAVIGPNADDAEVLLGNYNGIPAGPVTLLEGIRNKLKSKIYYEPGCRIAGNIPLLLNVPSSALSHGKNKPGLKAEYFDGNDFTGKPAVTKIDRSVDFNWWEETAAKGLKPDGFSVRWSGQLIPPVSGEYSVGVSVFGAAKLFLDDSLIVDLDDRHVVLTKWKNMVLEANKRYKIKMEYRDRRADASVKLLWAPPDNDLKGKAVRAAMKADAVILCLGLSPRLEGEEMDVDVPGFSGGDRSGLGLPQVQEELLEAIINTGKPTALVVLNGSAVAINRANDLVSAVVEAFYPGQAAGTAVADVLFGDYNPAGRLPVTFYASAEDLPPFEDYSMKERTYKYFTGEPLYRFGHGLSYTKFVYRDLEISPKMISPGDSITVTVSVKNAGSVAGDEVAQLYVRRPGALYPAPAISLQGFRRIHLGPGEEKSVSFWLKPKQLSAVDDGGRRSVKQGPVELSVGGRQPLASDRYGEPVTDLIVGTVEINGAEYVVGENE